MKGYLSIFSKVIFLSLVFMMLLGLLGYLREQKYVVEDLLEWVYLYKSTSTSTNGIYEIYRVKSYVKYCSLRNTTKTIAILADLKIKDGEICYKEHCEEEKLLENITKDIRKGSIITISCVDGVVIYD